jgi:hypothetical protein
LVKYGNLAGKIGQIGEMFGAAASYLYFNKGQKAYKEVMQDFIGKSGFTKSAGI